MIHLLAAATATGGASTLFAILASAVIVLGGLAALVRAIWRTATVMRDNTQATQQLTTRMDQLVTSVDGRFDQLLHRVDALESQAQIRDARADFREARADTREARADAREARNAP